MCFRHIYKFPLLLFFLQLSKQRHKGLNNDPKLPKFGICEIRKPKQSGSRARTCHHLVALPESTGQPSTTLY